MAAPTPPQRASVSPLALALPQALGAEGRATLGGLFARGVHRIVVLRPNHRLGNTLLVTPLLAELEQHFPGAEVDVVTGCEAAGDLLAGFRQVRHVHQLTRRPGHHPVRLFRLLRALRRRRYDLAIDCARGSRSGRWLVHWCRPRQWVAPPADGAELARAGIAWRTAWGKADGHFGLDAVHALRCALGSTEPSAAPMPLLAIRLREEELRDGRATLDQLLGAWRTAERGTRVVAIFPNATGSKRLSGSWWREFIAGLSAHDRALRVGRRGRPLATGWQVPRVLFQRCASDGRFDFGLRRAHQRGLRGDAPGLRNWHTDAGLVHPVESGAIPALRSARRRNPGGARPRRIHRRGSGNGLSGRAWRSSGWPNVRPAGQRQALAINRGGPH